MSTYGTFDPGTLEQQVQQRNYPAVNSELRGTQLGQDELLPHMSPWDFLPITQDRLGSILNAKTGNNPRDGISRWVVIQTEAGLRQFVADSTVYQQKLALDQTDVHQPEIIGLWGEFFYYHYGLIPDNDIVDPRGDRLLISWASEMGGIPFDLLDEYDVHVKEGKDVTDIMLNMAKHGQYPKFNPFTESMSAESGLGYDHRGYCFLPECIREKLEIHPYIWQYRAPHVTRLHFAQMNGACATIDLVALCREQRQKAGKPWKDEFPDDMDFFQVSQTRRFPGVEETAR
jgi:hypothetical protein